jgi:hypothetical protein
MIRSNINVLTMTKYVYIKMNVCVCLFVRSNFMPGQTAHCYETLSTYCLHSREGYVLFSGSFLLSYAKEDH